MNFNWNSYLDFNWNSALEFIWIFIAHRLKQFYLHIWRLNGTKNPTYELFHECTEREKKIFSLFFHLWVLELKKMLRYHILLTLENTIGDLKVYSTKFLESKARIIIHKVEGSLFRSYRNFISKFSKMKIYNKDMNI